MKGSITYRMFLLLALAGLSASYLGQGTQSQTGLRFELSFPSSVREQPVTGRVFLMISKTAQPEPRFQVGSWANPTPIFALDVEGLAPGEPAVIDAATPGYPLQSLSEIARGEYSVQALLNVYTEFHRSDGHVIWAHMDRWEGQQFNKSPGNLFSSAEKVRWDPRERRTVKLSLERAIPEVDVPRDTEWVKRIKIESKLLSRFWGRPISLGATVLLPKGYEEHPDAEYPAIYLQGHFSLDAPFGFSRQPEPARGAAPARRVNVREPPPDFKVASGALGMPESGFEFYRAWTSEDFPRLMAITFQHPTPYFDDSYAVNSANNGPYGDAIMTELIPFLEERFRLVRKPYARVLTGGSTGGWESLALQVFHPDFFGGTWTFYPDPVDFRRYCFSNIYEDDNAFLVPGREWLPQERYFYRSPEGQPLGAMRQLSQLEAVLGRKGRSGQQLDAWQAVYGPVGEDGYPKPLWDKRTGQIDRDVAFYMRDHGYDLRHYLETRWSEIGPKLVGKIHLICGDMDDYFLNLAVYLLEDFLESTKNPYYGGSFQYGRPMKGHGWAPTTNADLVRQMAEHMARNAPPGENPPVWRYR